MTSENLTIDELYELLQSVLEDLVDVLSSTYDDISVSLNITAR